MGLGSVEGAGDEVDDGEDDGVDEGSDFGLVSVVPPALPPAEVSEVASQPFISEDRPTRISK